jgi:DNA-binding NtrC family response regulator
MGHRKRVIYVVDDERIIAETIAMILIQAGFDASFFQDPKAALAAAGSVSKPDLLISDVVMPHMSGIELALRFREAAPRCRVLLFSGHVATTNLLAIAREQGHEFDILTKPVHPSDLLAKVREYSQEGREAPMEAHAASAMPSARKPQPS